MTGKRKIIFAVIITFILTFSLCSYINHSGQDYKIQNELYALINKKYVKAVDNNKLREGACRGMLSSLGDIHSYYMTGEEYNILMENVTGNYRGIGVEVYLDGNDLIVTSVFSGTPAYNAGIMPGDILRGVDSFSFTPEKYAEFIRYLKGISQDGASVSEMTLHIERQGQKKEIVVNRDNITQQTVYKEEIEGILYLRLTDFTKSTKDEFKTAISGYENYRGLIIDVRDNPGGLLKSVLDVSDILLPRCTITYTKDRYGNIRKFTSDENHIDTRIVVLINGKSASAAEIFAASLHDNKKAYLIGEKTYGKGSVQEIFKLSDGSAAKLTIAYYYTPADICIDNLGVEPDLFVPMPEEAYSAPLHMLDRSLDSQLREAVSYLSH